jgi:hypothetical protein
MTKSVYLNQRIKKKTVKKLRKFEQKYRTGKNPSISETIELLLLGFDYFKWQADRNNH